MAISSLNAGLEANRAKIGEPDGEALDIVAEKIDSANLISRLDHTEDVVRIADGVYAYEKGVVRTNAVMPTNKRVIGTGAAGDVHSSRMYKGIVVKKFKNQDIDGAREELSVGMELDHPNLNKSHAIIIKHYDESFKMKLVMDRAKGQTLTSMNRNGDKYAAANMKKIFAQLKSVFIYLIQNNHFWADLNTGNIFLTENGDLTLVDFGAWGKHSRFSKNSLLYSQISEAAQSLLHLVSLSDTENKEALLDIIRERKTELEREVLEGGITNPETYLKEKIEELFTLVP